MNIHVILILLGGCLLAPVWAALPPENLVFQAGDLGNLKGSESITKVKGRPFIQFKGIPYAKALTEETRFLPSEELDRHPLAPAPGIFDATKNGPCCRQWHVNALCISQNEDCLNLNIFTTGPKKDDQDPGRPVIVFIHGGGFSSGSADVYGAERFLDEDVILVTFNYRLGVLGFFYLNDNMAPGNAAMYDMVNALKFVKKYISYFGGDPTRITMAGHSAGSASVSHLLLSPMTRDKDLFHGVIALSGSALSNWAWTTGEAAEAASLKIAAMVNCYDASQSPVKSAIVACMKTVDPSELIDAFRSYQFQQNVQGRLGHDAISPVIQGDQVTVPRFLDESPGDILERKAGANVPLIMGATRHDGTFVLAMTWDTFITQNGYQNDPEFLKNELIPALAKSLGITDETEDSVELLGQTYFTEEALTSGDFTEMLPGLTDLHSVFAIKARALRLVELHSRYQTQAYWYNFDYQGEFSLYNLMKNDTGNPVKGGIAHADDLIYLFNIPTAPLNAKDQEFSSRLVKYWANFAYSGNPNTVRRIDNVHSRHRRNTEWPVYSEISPGYISLNATDAVFPDNPGGSWIHASDELYADWPEESSTASMSEPTEPTEEPTTPDSSLLSAQISTFTLLFGFLLKYLTV